MGEGEVGRYKGMVDVRAFVQWVLAVGSSDDCGMC